MDVKGMSIVHIIVTVANGLVQRLGSRWNCGTLRGRAERDREDI